METPVPRIRDAELADAPRLAEVFDAVLRDGRGVVMPPGAGLGADGVASRLPGYAAYLVAEVDGEVVGEATLRGFGPAWLAHGAMLAMHVHPDAQGRGVGRALLRAGIARARDLGLERVELYVRGDNDRAVALYRSEGFVLEGVRRAFVRPDGARAVDDLVMARFLHPPRWEKVLALVVRQGAGGPELLVFQHPLAGTQLPRGTLEPGEAPEAAVFRELQEESGLTSVHLVATLPPWDHPMPQTEDDGLPVLHRTHAFVLAPDGPLPDAWTWAATGSEEEDGLVFAYAWQPLAHVHLHPVFGEAVDRLRALRL